MTVSNNLNLGKTHFYWRVTDQPNMPRNPVPDFLDFTFTFWDDYQLLIQERNPQTWQFLERIYQEDFNVGYLQEGHALAERYGNDFIGFIRETIDHSANRLQTVTEIGAGGCYILRELGKLGLQATAIDPSPATALKGKEYGINVIPEFYPPTRGLPLSDLIIHYDVLEHIPDPIAFLRHHRSNLTPEGMIVFAVPDCTPYIAKGDISMILHEHLNYFNQHSLDNVVRAAGFVPLQIRPANYGGVLYCAARLNETSLPWVPESGRDAFHSFAARAESLIHNVRDFVSLATRGSNSLGCYIPLRSLPYITPFRDCGKIRFFDDDPGVYGKYFDGFDIPVENFTDLCARPVTHLLVMSFAFGEIIRQRITGSLPEGEILIRTFGDFQS